MFRRGPVPCVRNANKIAKINITLLDLCSADKSLKGLEFCGFIGSFSKKLILVKKIGAKEMRKI